MVGDERAELKTAHVKELAESIHIITKDLRSRLAAFKIVPFSAKRGEKFDPTKHQALTPLHDEGESDKSVTNVLKPGFTIRDRVLRPALVDVK